MSPKRSNPYPSKFKESSVKLAIESDISIAQTAKNLGINVNTLHNWISKYSKLEPAMQSKDHHYDEIKNLKKQLARVTEERDLLKALCKSIPIKYAWIKANRGTFSISTMCRFMNVSRSGYYEWFDRPMSSRDLKNIELTNMIKEIFEEGRKVYGTRRIANKLRQKGIIISRRRIASGLKCKTKRKFKTTTDSKHDKLLAPNLLKRQFHVAAPNRYWVGDITYIPTQKGWLYLAVVIDLYSRQIVGWSMDDNMKADLVNAALLMAIWSRKPAKGFIWHTDRGSQYASDSHRKILKDHKIIQSMSRKGNCWDNAVSESFFHTLKTELTHHHKFKNQEEAKNVIFEYIEVFYNRIRTHSANNYLAPVEFERVKKYI